MTLPSLLLIAISLIYSEPVTIYQAGLRNNCTGDDMLLLFAIRAAENGRRGLEFGIMNPKANNLDKQAGWAAATIMNQHHRSSIQDVNDRFIESLGRRYCPVDCDNDNGTNQYWIKNVKYFYFKAKARKKVNYVH